MSRNQAASANHLFQMKGFVPVHAHELSKDLLGKEEWLLTNGSLYVSAGGHILLSAIGMASITGLSVTFAIVLLSSALGQTSFIGALKRTPTVMAGGQNSQARGPAKKQM